MKSFDLHINLAIDPERTSPNAAGEMLRHWFFPPKPEGEWHGETIWTRGCYSSFDHIEATPLPDPDARAMWSAYWRPHLADYQWESDEIRERVDESLGDGQAWVTYCNGVRVEVGWWWDGDGTLIFRFPNGVILANSDCKKDYEWEWING